MSDSGMSLEEIGAELGMTRGGVHLIVKKALEKVYKKATPQFREEIVKHFSDPAMVPEELKPKD